MLTVTAAALQSIAVTPANPSDRQGADAAVHGDRHLQRQLHAEPDEPGDVGVGDDRGRHDHGGGLATGVARARSTISATLGGVTGSTVLTVTSVVCTDTVLHLHRAGTNLTLEAVAPATGPANFVDSPALSRSGGNPYRPIGVWEGYIDGIECDLVSLSDLHVWLACTAATIRARIST